MLIFLYGLHDTDQRYDNIGSLQNIRIFTDMYKKHNVMYKKHDRMCRILSFCVKQL